MQLHPKTRERFKAGGYLSLADRRELERLLRKIQRRSVIEDIRTHAEQALVLLGVEKWEL